MTPEQRIDAALDSVLKASGSALRHYTMPKTLADMREAMRKVMFDEYIRGLNDNVEAMGYKRCITYTQADETGASLRAAGWVKVKTLEARKSWAESSVALKDKRDPVGNGGVPRVLWECRIHGA